MGELLHLVQREGVWVGCGPAHPPPRCIKCKAHPSTASVPITVLLYYGPLLCGFNVAIKRFFGGLVGKSRSISGTYAVEPRFGSSLAG